MIYRSFWIFAALSGGAAASQAPEFAQQYRQRLGGALDELRAVIADFDRDAAGSGLSREEALATYDGSTQAFLNARGLSMRGSVERLARLERQTEIIRTTPNLMWPMIVARDPDPRLSEGTAADFRPAVPLTAEGATYAAAGALTVAFLISLLHRVERILSGRGWNGRRRRRV